MLTEPEWALVGPLMDSGIRIIKEYRRETHATLKDTLDKLPFDSSTLVHSWTGFWERDPTNFHHHRLSGWGAPCADCGRL